MASHDGDIEDELLRNRRSPPVAAPFSLSPPLAPPGVCRGICRGVHTAMGAAAAGEAAKSGLAAGLGASTMLRGEDGIWWAFDEYLKSFYCGAELSKHKNSPQKHTHNTNTQTRKKVQKGRGETE